MGFITRWSAILTLSEYVHIIYVCMGVYIEISDFERLLESIVPHNYLCTLGEFAHREAVVLLQMVF